ncbi:MAG TPA: S-adenosylmethionine:tRNA ribosyltransferase-isomerase [Thermoplasmata archaeon]|nr:S-adenosylmethionine:tRNA ribosyltransferase-isomerase [Thermoplasmata archaeon]
MKTSELAFERPPGLEATAPPELTSGARDAVRLLVSRPDGRTVVRFDSLPDTLRPGDLLVVNRSATVSASLPARAAFGEFRLNLSTDYGRGVWLAEPRFAADRPGPVPLGDGEPFVAGGLPAAVVAAYPGLPRLTFVRLSGDVRGAMSRVGEPIRYGYVGRRFPIDAYRTIFGDRPGSAEMPSAGRPFTSATLAGLAARGIDLARVTLHAGVSSVEIGSDDVAAFPLYPEPFEVPEETVEAVERARGRGGRVVAVGTTVVRALESAGRGGTLRAARGFTRAFVRPERPPEVADVLLTGLHDPRTSHLAMLAAFAGIDRLREDYRAAVAERLLWHEFGDSHLIFRDGRAG